MSRYKYQFLLIFFFFPVIAFSASCSGVPISGNYTVSTSCTFAGTVDGVDAGTGTSNTANIVVNNGTTLTVNAGQTVVWGGTITVNGSIAISSTGQLKQGPLWMTDADADGYSDSALTQIVQSTQPTNGRRRSAMTSVTQIDYQPSNAGAYLATKAITAFSIGSQTSYAISEANHTVKISMPGGTSLTSLTPTITHNGSSISPASGAAQNFSSPVTYTVTGADSTTQAYTVTVVACASGTCANSPANGECSYKSGDYCGTCQYCNGSSADCQNQGAGNDYYNDCGTDLYCSDSITVYEYSGVCSAVAACASSYYQQCGAMGDFCSSGDSIYLDYDNSSCQGAGECVVDHGSHNYCDWRCTGGGDYCDFWNYSACPHC